MLAHGTEGMAEQLEKTVDVAEPVGSDELNAWNPVFTPHPEISKGRLTIICLSAGQPLVLHHRLIAAN